MTEDDYEWRQFFSLFVKLMAGCVVGLIAYQLGFRDGWKTYQEKTRAHYQEIIDNREVLRVE